MLNEQDRHASRCIRCETCDGFPCLVSAKSDAQVCAVDPALKYANVTLKTNAYVERLETNPSGREISKVIIRNNGTREEVSGDIVVSSCGAINSAALLLRSANDKHPKGLANSSRRRWAPLHGPRQLRIDGTVKSQSDYFPEITLVNDFYFGSEDWTYPMGHISFVRQARRRNAERRRASLTPGWTLDLMARPPSILADLRGPARSQQPRDPDSNGGIVLTYTPNNEEGHKRLIAKLKELMQQQTKCNVHGHECHEGLFLATCSLASASLWQALHTKLVRFASATILEPVRWTLTASA